jgi:hypothetical protein
MVTSRLAALLLLCGLLPGLDFGGHGRSLPEAVFDQTGTITTTEGHATLSWTVRDAEDPTLEFELQDSDHADFSSAHTRYRGPDRASFVSGLPAGKTWFRVRVTEIDRAGPWSEPIAINVEYPSRSLLRRLLALGAIVFVATVLTIVAGHRRREVPAR